MTLTITSKYAEITRFLNQCEPFAKTPWVKEAVYLCPSDEMDELFGYCPDFCPECAEKIIHRISDAMTIGWGMLLVQSHRMAMCFWDRYKTWMFSRLPNWGSDCDLYYSRSSCGDSLEYCELCGSLLDLYADIDSDLGYWEERFEEGKIQLDEDDAATLYFLLHELCEDSEFVDRVHAVVSRFQVPTIGGNPS